MGIPRVPPSWQASTVASFFPAPTAPRSFDALLGAYWARAWATGGFTQDWSVRLVRSLLGLVGGAGREPQSAKTSRLSWTKNVWSCPLFSSAGLYFVLVAPLGTCSSE